MNYLVTGGAGFIGSHLVDRLIGLGHFVTVVDNLSAGFIENVNPRASFFKLDISNTEHIVGICKTVGIRGIFHLAAIARTPWCIDDPQLANQVNVGGTLSILEAARRASVGRTVLSSSNVVYAAHTPYRATKEMGEMWGRVYNELYGVSNVSLRYSNVYGPRQSERGPSPNVFAAFRKSHRENGYIAVTGDGTQTRQFTHVHDIVSALILAMVSEYVGQPLDIVNETRWSMNEVVKIWGSTPKYLPERVGDVKHIIQSAEAANKVLGWEPTIGLCDGIKTCFECPEYMR